MLKNSTRTDVCGWLRRLLLTIVHDTRELAGVVSGHLILMAMQISFFL